MQSITQVFGLLFGNGDSEDSIEGSGRKRSRSTKYMKDKRNNTNMSSVVSSSSLESLVSENNQPRKRGRPKGTFKVKPRVKLVPTTGLRELNNLVSIHNTEIRNQNLKNRNNKKLLYVGTNYG